MRTARYSDSGGLPGTETPPPTRRNVGPGSQTGNDIIQRPPPMYRMTDVSENITLPQTSFTGGNEKMVQ